MFKLCAVCVVTPRDRESLFIASDELEVYHIAIVIDITIETLTLISTIDDALGRKRFCTPRMYREKSRVIAWP